MEAVRQGRPDHLGQGVRDGPEARFALRQLGGCRGELALLLVGGAESAPQVQLCHHLTGQHPQGPVLEIGQAFRTGLGVDDAQGAERQPARTAKDDPGVEPDVRLAVDQRIVRETRVRRGVGNDEVGILLNGERAEGDVLGRFQPFEADASLEPLAVFTDQADQRGRDVAEAAGQIDDIVERLLGSAARHAIGIEDSKALILGPAAFGGVGQRGLG